MLPTVGGSILGARGRVLAPQGSGRLTASILPAKTRWMKRPTTHSRAGPKPSSAARPPSQHAGPRRHGRERFDPLAQRTLAVADVAQLPVVRIKSAAWRPLVFRKQVLSVAPEAAPGDLVVLEDAAGQPLGYGLYNPFSEIVVRVLSPAGEPADEAFWQQRLERAVSLRRDLLHLDDASDAYRLVHAEGDGLSGLVADRLGDVLSIEVFSLAMYQRAAALAEWLAAHCGLAHWIVRASPRMHGQEGYLPPPLSSPEAPSQVTIRELGTRFRIRFAGGHKTGFFCDQRDNRRRLAELCRDRTVLDLCAYTGGFAIQAKRLGGARAVTAVELDAEPLRLARENANMNQVRIDLVEADVFAYMRDMLRGGRQYDVVVLDPPKLINTRRELEEGARKHLDLNRLAMQLVRPGGLLLSCSCAGLLSEEAFLRLLYTAARQAGPPPSDVAGTAPNQPIATAPSGAGSGSGVAPSAAAARSAHSSGAAGRTLQVLARSGAGPDHPVAANYPESEYLKAVWMRVH